MTSKRNTSLGVEHGCVAQIDALMFKDVKASDNGTVTTEHRIFPDGKLFHPSDSETPMTFDASFRRGLMDTFSKTGLDVQIDFNHLSAGGFFSYPSIDDGAAAGWVTSLEDRGADGLWGKFEWTDRGLQAVRAREYRYLSPEFSFKHYDKGTGTTAAEPRLYAVALTNRPFLEQQQRIAATDSAAKGESMLNKDDGATAEAKLADVQKQLDEANRKIALGEETKRIQDAALAEVHKQQRLSDVEAAVAAGKVTPALRPMIEKFAEAHTREDLATLLSNLPVQTRAKPVGQGDKPETDDGTALTDADKAAARFIGLSEKDFKKYSNWEGASVTGQLVKGVA